MDEVFKLVSIEESPKMIKSKKINKAFIYPPKKQIERSNSNIGNNAHFGKIIKKNIRQNIFVKNIEFNVPESLQNQMSRNNAKLKLKPLTKNLSCPQLVMKQKKTKKNRSRYNANLRVVKVDNLKCDNSNNSIFDKNDNINQIKLTKTFYQINNNKSKIYTNNNFYDNNNKLTNDINCNDNFYRLTNKIRKWKKIERKVNDDRIVNFENEINTLMPKRLPINNLKFYHNFLFNEHKFPQSLSCEDGKIRKSIDDQNNENQYCNSNSQTEDKEFEYEIMEFGGKKNFVATRLKNMKKKESENKERSNSLVISHRSPKKQQDYHYIMKHPFLCSYFSDCFINNYSENYKLNSYTNNKNEKYCSQNPLKDKDLTDKIHHLILNPNTYKIRNEKLLLTYKNNQKYLINEQKRIKLYAQKNLKKLQKNKYRDYIVQLDETLQRAKYIQKKLDNLVLNNKKEYGENFYLDNFN